jgi:hypothetical protein
VNLDEVLPHANGKPLPPLQITTRPTSTPPSRRSPNNNAVAGSSQSRAGTPKPTNRRAGPSNAAQLGLGPKPELDEGKITELLSLDAGLCFSMKDFTTYRAYNVPRNVDVTSFNNA